MSLYLLSQFRRKTVQRHEVGESGFLMAKDAWNCASQTHRLLANARQMIAYSSLSCVPESDYHLGDGETAAGPTTSILGSPFSPVQLPEQLREIRVYFAEFRRTKQIFSGSQTEWRRERDSNPPLDVVST